MNLSKGTQIWKHFLKPFHTLELLPEIEKVEKTEEFSTSSQDNIDLSEEDQTWNHVWEPSHISTPPSEALKNTEFNSNILRVRLLERYWTTQYHYSAFYLAYPVFWVFFLLLFFWGFTKRFSFIDVECFCDDDGNSQVKVRQVTMWCDQH